MVKVPAPPDALYGLEDLLVAAGELLGEVISPRTVRLYATQGLIDRPGKEGRSAVYGHRHLLQLLLGAGSDPRSSWKGKSALEISRQKKHAECVRVLEAALS